MTHYKSLNKNGIGLNSHNVLSTNIHFTLMLVYPSKIVLFIFFSQSDKIIVNIQQKTQVQYAFFRLYTTHHCS